MTAARVLDCLAGQWIEWRDVMASNGLPDEVIESFVRPVFYSGALSVMALLAEGVDATAIKEELERYAMENADFEPEYHA